MSQTFWSNTIWYVILGTVTIIELIFIIKKRENRQRVLAFFLSISGVTFNLEMVVYSFLKGYHYYPMIIPQSPPDDSIAGNIFSQFFISATALLLAVYNLRFRWFIVFSVAIGAIEQLFLKLGIYEQNWYRSWMTVFGLLPIFWAVKKLYVKTTHHMGRWWRYLFVYHGLVTLFELTINWPLRLLGIRLLSENFLPDQERSLVVLSAITMLLLGGITMFIYYSRTHKIWKTAIVISLYLAYFAAEKADLIFFKEGWFLIATSIGIWGMLLYTYILDTLYNHRDLRPGRTES